MRQAFADFMAHTLFYNCISVFLKHCATLDKHFSNTSYKQWTNIFLIQVIKIWRGKSIQWTFLKS